jgi:hypothetical protein
MGHWSLARLHYRVEDYDAGRAFGHVFTIIFSLRYLPLPFFKYKETPPLVYHEKIVTKSPGRGEFWQASFDQYQRNPLAQTMRPWSRRYLEARAGDQTTLTRGRTRLTHSHDGRTVSPRRFERRDPGTEGPAQDEAEDPASAVRNYLGKRGGTFEIVIEDRPHIEVPVDDNIDRERLVQFTVGVRGCSEWLMAYQYLRVVGTTTRTRELRVRRVHQRVQPSWDPLPAWAPITVTGFTADNLKEIAAPGNVTLVHDPVWQPGESR